MAANALGRGSATAGNLLNRGEAASNNALSRGTANVNNANTYYNTKSALTRDAAINAANNAFYMSDAAQRGAANVGNAASTSAYNVGNAQANAATNIGNARASGYAGTANAFNNALGQITAFAVNAPTNRAVANYYARRTT
jgi:hypothetical protein